MISVIWKASKLNVIDRDNMVIFLIYLYLRADKWQRKTHEQPLLAAVMQTINHKFVWTLLTELESFFDS